MSRIEDVSNGVGTDAGMSIFNKFIERSGMEKSLINMMVLSGYCKTN